MIDLSHWKTWIVTASPQDFWIWCAILGVMAALSGYGIFHFIRRARLIEDTPTAKVRSAAQGYLELIGRGKYLGDKPLVAPLTGTPCTWYSYKIEREATRSSAKSTAASKRAGAPSNPKPARCPFCLWMIPTSALSIRRGRKSYPR